MPSQAGATLITNFVKRDIDRTVSPATFPSSEIVVPVPELYEPRVKRQQQAPASRVPIVTAATR